MSAARLKFTAILLAVTLIAVGVALWQFLAARVARDELAVRTWRLADLETRRASLQEQLAAAQQRVAAAARDRASVRTTVRESVARVEARASAEKEAVTAEMVQTRYQRARELARSGQSEEALREFLWCFDVGMPRVGVSPANLFTLIVEIGQLGKKYPEALAALRVRRDQIEARVLASESDTEAVSEFANLNRTLSENDRTIELYDRFPAGDRRRRLLASGAFETLVDSQRYDVALEGRPYGSMSSAFETMIQERPVIAAMPNVDAIRKGMREAVIKSTARNIEVLAGAGDLGHARALIDRLLAYDGSDGTKAVVLTHLERAGHADLLAAAPKP